eukprot:691418-Rhodomonas_salina.2
MPLSTQMPTLALYPCDTPWVPQHATLKLQPSSTLLNPPQPSSTLLNPPQPSTPNPLADRWRRRTVTPLKVENNSVAAWPEVPRVHISMHPTSRSLEPPWAESGPGMT